MISYLLEHINWVAAVLLVLLLWHTVDWFKYYAKMLIFAVGSLLVASILPLPLFIVRPGHYKNALGPAWGCRVLLRLLGVSYEVRGSEHIHRDHGAVVLINHQSFIDLAVLAHLWPIVGRATVVAKRLVKFMFPPSAGWGTLFIDRSNQADSRNRMGAQAAAIAERAAKLLVFPEGTRGGESGQLLPFKKGPFHIAVQSQAAVQPVVVSRYWFLDGGEKKRFGRGHTIISILPEIQCRDLDKTNVDELLASTQLLMQAEYDRINAEAYERNIQIAQ